MITLSLSADICDRYDDIHIGFMAVRGIVVPAENPWLEELRATVIDEFLQAGHTLNSLPNEPRIKTWMTIYRSFGAKPSKFPCSVYKLSRDVLKRGRFPQIDPRVDVYNLMSLRHLVPMAGYDVDKIEGGVVLRFSSEGEVFLPIGAREVERLTSGEPVYADAEKILCSKWNYRDSELTKLTAETSNVLFVVDGASPVTAEYVQVVLDELSELVAHWNPKEKAHAIISSTGVREIEL